MLDKLKKDLFKETNRDVSLKVERNQNKEELDLKFLDVENLHLSILIENMRREGYEFTSF